MNIIVSSIYGSESFNLCFYNNIQCVSHKLFTWYSSSTASTWELGSADVLVAGFPAQIPIIWLWDYLISTNERSENNAIIIYLQQDEPLMTWNYRFLLSPKAHSYEIIRFSFLPYTIKIFTRILINQMMKLNHQFILGNFWVTNTVTSKSIINTDIGGWRKMMCK